jgi:hypothetical protein
MVKKRREQARIGEMHDLGQRNVETLRSARGWCKHLNVEMTSYGLLAEMSGLPIGSHDVTCPHAEHGLGGMNLPMILPEFVIQNCRGCASHIPNGDTEWGDRVIAEYEARVKRANERQTLLAAQLKEVRASRRMLAREAQGQADFTVHRVLELTEGLFGEDASGRSDASELLRQAAKIAPELFHPAAVDLILMSAPQPPLADLCLPVAAALAARRGDLADRLVSVAVEAIDAGLSVETACEILVDCGCGNGRPFPAGVIEKVIGRLNHIRPFGGWSTRHLDRHFVDVPPTYDFSTCLLGKAYDQDPEVVLAPLRAALRDNNKFRRVNACGVVQELLRQRSAIGAALLPVVVDSLDLDDDVFNDSADSEALTLIKTIFFREPMLTDGLLRDRFERQSQEARCLTAGAYRQILWSEWDEETQVEPTRFREAIELAFRRSLALVQDQSLDLEVRQQFVDAVEAACHNHPDVSMIEFDTLLGTLACLYTQDEPPAPPPRIILPSDAPLDPQLQSLERANRRMSWDHFKTKIAQCLEVLAGERPELAAERLLRCFANLDSKTNEALKAAVVRLLGEVGRQRELLPRVLPLLWKALMDYDSNFVRCRGIEAVTRCFESADCDPPLDVVEALVLHLRDSFVIVHDAAIRAIGWNTHWLAPTQAEDAIQQFVGWAATYRKKNCFKLKDICRPILSLSRTVPAMRYGTVRFIAGLLPTGEHLVDAGLIELLIERVDAEEDGAFCVAPQAAAWLARHRRDPLDHHDGVLNQVYDWLRALPVKTFQKARGALVKAGQAVAESGDAWSVLRFAAIFASFGDFQAEADVLGAGKRSLPKGRRNERLIQTLGELEQAAKANEQLARE